MLASHFSTRPWMKVPNVAGLGGTNVTFSPAIDRSGAFGVECSINLAGWFFLGPATPRYLFTDTDTNAPVDPQRDYRLRLP